MPCTRMLHLGRGRGSGGQTPPLVHWPACEPGTDLLPPEERELSSNSHRNTIEACLQQHVAAGWAPGSRPAQRKAYGMNEVGSPETLPKSWNPGKVPKRGVA